MQVGVALLLCNRGGLRSLAGRRAVRPEGAREQRLGPPRAPGRGQAEALLDPRLDLALFRVRPPHPDASGRVQREVGVHLAFQDRVVGELDRGLHRLHETLAVEAQAVGGRETVPEPRQLGPVVLELDRAPVEADRILELVAADGQHSRSAQPPAGLRPAAQPPRPRRPPRPGRRPRAVRPPRSGGRAAAQARRARPRSARASVRSPRAGAPGGLCGRLSYATSRVSACLIAYSRSPGIDEPARRRTKSRSSSTRRSGSPSTSS